MEEREKSERTAPEVDAEKVESAESHKTDMDSEMTKRVICALAYFWNIFFFLPLIMYKDNTIATRSANDSLVLLLFSIASGIFFGIISGIFLLLGYLSVIFIIITLILGITFFTGISILILTYYCNNDILLFVNNNLLLLKYLLK